MIDDIRAITPTQEAKCLKKLLDCIEDIGMAMSDAGHEAGDESVGAEAFDRIAHQAILRLLQMSSRHSVRLMVGKQSIDIRGGYFSTTAIVAEANRKGEGA